MCSMAIDRLHLNAICVAVACGGFLVRQLILCLKHQADDGEKLVA